MSWELRKDGQDSPRWDENIWAGKDEKDELETEEGWAGQPYRWDENIWAGKDEKDELGTEEEWAGQPQVG